MLQVNIFLLTDLLREAPYYLPLWDSKACEDIPDCILRFEPLVGGLSGVYRGTKMSMLTWYTGHSCFMSCVAYLISNIFLTSKLCWIDILRSVFSGKRNNEKYFPECLRVSQKLWTNPSDEVYGSPTITQERGSTLSETWIDPSPDTNVAPHSHYHPLSQSMFYIGKSNI